jgi:beta-galactosidase
MVKTNVKLKFIMLNLRCLFIIVFGALVFVKPSVAQTGLTDSISLNGTWKFKTDLYKVGDEEKWYKTNLSIAAWEDIQVPGNWEIKNEYAYYTGDAWYRNTFVINEAAQAKHIRLLFESVYNDAEIWINDTKIGEHHLGFLAFSFDINKHIKFGAENTIVLKVSNFFKRGAIWNWGGIRRPVWLEITNPLRINYAHINALPNFTDGTATIDVKTDIANNANVAFNGYYIVNILYKNKLVVKSTKQPISQLSATKTISLNAQVQLDAANVHLWHFAHPELYTAEVNLYQQDKLVHRFTDRFGIRKVEVDGFKLKLNGKEIRTVGFNLVAEDRVHGNTLPFASIKKMVDMMKASGANMARLSHLALPKALLDYLDEKGIMVFEEVSLWGKDTLTNPGNTLPKIWLEKLIQQQYNHPSVIGWSVGNEIGSYKNNPHVYNYIKTAIEQAKSLDPNRLVTYASNSAPGQPDDAAALCDLIFINSYDNWGKVADKLHKLFPTKAVFFSEFGNDLNKENLDEGIVPIEKMLTQLRGRDYVIGASLWTFNDYRSNYWSLKSSWNTAPSENRTWGIVNSFLQPKKAYFDVKKQYQPFIVKNLQINANENAVSGSLSLAGRDLLSFPAFEMKGYALNVVSKNKLGKSITEKRTDIATLQPGETSPVINFQIPIDANTNLVSVQIIDALGYNRYDSVLYLQKPNLPKILGIYTDLDAIRVVFDNDNSANHYFLKYGTNQLNKTTNKVALTNFIEMKDLSRDSTYQFELFAQNNVGVTSTIVKDIKLKSTEMPPIIWGAETTSTSIHISFESDPLDFKYEVEYGTQSGIYQKRLLFENKGVIQLPHLKSNQVYFYRMRRILQWGYASEWTNEMNVTTK